VAHGVAGAVGQQLDGVLLEPPAPPASAITPRVATLAVIPLSASERV
jgi:hypothetical protein